VAKATFLIHRSLRLSGRAHRAGLSAGTALDAHVRIDDVLAITLRDGLHGALRSAGAAADAVIGNFVCHWKTPPKLVLEIYAKSLALGFPNTILSYFSKKAIHK